MDFRKSAAYSFCTPIARFATRPGSGDLSDEDRTEVTPDLIMGTLMRNGAHLLKSDYIYEMVMNEMTGVIELHEVGQTTIGKKWGRAYYDIATDGGSRIWLSKEERAEIDAQDKEKYGESY